MSKWAIGVALCSVVLAVPVSAKKPAAEDEAAIRLMIEQVYAPYSQPYPEPSVEGSTVPDNDPGAAMDGYELPYTATLDVLVSRWSGLMLQTEELYGLNSFDWYCQCQDNDNETSRLVRQAYKQAGKDRITASILFSPGQSDGKATGQPLIFQFRREGGAWKLDDMKFHDFTTLRRGLASDILDASKDMAPN